MGVTPWQAVRECKIVKIWILINKDLWHANSRKSQFSDSLLISDYTSFWNHRSRCDPVLFHFFILPSDCLCSLNGLLIVSIIHFSFIIALSGRCLTNKKYCVHFIIGLIIVYYLYCLTLLFSGRVFLRSDAKALLYFFYHFQIIHW